MKRGKAVRGLVLSVVFVLLGIVMNYRFHGAFEAARDVWAETKPPMYYLLTARIWALEFTILIPVIFTLWYAFALFDPEPDWDAIDWRSLKPILRKLCYPPKDHGGHVSEPGIIQQLEQCCELIERLETCDPEQLRDVVSTEWGSYSSEKKKSLAYALDGEEDVADWLNIMHRKRIALLSSLLDLTGDVVLWREQNGNKTERGGGGPWIQYARNTV